MLIWLGLNALTENTVTAQEQFDLTEVVSQVIISLESKITGRNLDVDVQMPDEKLMVWGDPDSITQVCYNHFGQRGEVCRRRYCYHCPDHKEGWEGLHHHPESGLYDPQG